MYVVRTVPVLTRDFDHVVYDAFGWSEEERATLRASVTRDEWDDACVAAGMEPWWVWPDADPAEFGDTMSDEEMVSSQSWYDDDRDWDYLAGDRDLFD